MRVLVESGAVEPDELERVVRGLEVDVVHLGTGPAIARRADDVVIQCHRDLCLLAARTRPPVRLGELEATPASATFSGRRLPLRRIETAVLYELVAASGVPLTRGALHARCWPSKTLLRTVDATICRLRPKLERATKVRLYNQRAVGYWLDTSEMKKRVLVVEDDTRLHNSYRRTLTQLGVEVEFAATFPTGQQIVERCTHDAYFVDLQLPDGSGADLVPMIQRRAPLAPIMIVSGRSDPTAIALSASLGVPYAIKPLDKGELARFVERTVLGRALFEER